MLCGALHINSDNGSNHKMPSSSQSDARLLSWFRADPQLHLCSIHDQDHEETSLEAEGMMLNIIPALASLGPWELKRMRICVSVDTNDFVVDRPF